MKVFKDRHGYEWKVDISVASVKRVKSLLDIDLLDIGDGKIIEKIAGNPVALCDVLYCVCKPQADERGVTDEQFGESLCGDAIERGSDALLDDLIDFFPSRRRNILAKALAKIRSIDSKMLFLAESQIDDPKIDLSIAEAIAKLGGNSSDDLQPSAASLQATSAA